MAGRPAAGCMTKPQAQARMATTPTKSAEAAAATRTTAAALPRRVQPETLDFLDPDDPQAQGSRRDLRRIHRFMGTRSIVRRVLVEMARKAGWQASSSPSRPLRLLELGAGDGSLLLGVARSLAPHWPAVELTLLDRQPLVDRSTVEAYAAFRWTVVAQVDDVFDWAATATATATDAATGAEAEAGTATGPAEAAGAVTGSGAATSVSTVGSAPAGARATTQSPPRWDLIVANLFLHHFEAAPLAGLLAAAAARGDRFLACEPRRSRLALAASRLVGAIGANAVTREDAVLSVHAGFCGNEIAALWPSEAGWRIDERPAGWFSHCFVAERTTDGAGAA